MARWQLVIEGEGPHYDVGDLMGIATIARVVLLPKIDCGHQRVQRIRVTSESGAQDVYQYAPPVEEEKPIDPAGRLRTVEETPAAALAEVPATEHPSDAFAPPHVLPAPL